MRLLKIEKDETTRFYFTGIQECANYLNVSYNAVNFWLKGVTKTCKGFTKAEWIESDTVLSGQINLTREKYKEIYGE